MVTAVRTVRNISRWEGPNFCVAHRNVVKILRVQAIFALETCNPLCDNRTCTATTMRAHNAQVFMVEMYCQCVGYNKTSRYLKDQLLRRCGVQYYRRGLEESEGFHSDSNVHNPPEPLPNPKISVDTNPTCS